MSLHSSRSRKRRGQTLVIAIMVMFILAVVATVFIALVARNLFRSARSYSTDAVASLAEAGVRYADEMLTGSDEGADWRPVPDNLAQAEPGNFLDGTPPTPVPNWQEIKDLDPDFRWLRPYWPEELDYAGPSGGYSRFNSGQGRFLLRVSYNPDPKIVMSKYIKIESIGRWGTIDPDDPTTLHDVAHYSLRREITAFKPIGITDYCRFVTNKDNRSADFALGVPGFRTSFGRSDTESKYGVRGGPIRVNGNLMWYGLWSNEPSIDIYLRGAEASDLTWKNTDILPVDGVEVAGDIKCDANPANEMERVNVRVHQILGNDINSIDVLPSTDDDIDRTVTRFITADGFYRDGRDTVDASTPHPRARGVERIEPPLVDQPDPTNTTTRYRVLTLNSGDRIGVGTTNPRWVNLGALGWGKGVYINNPNDKQDNSDTLGGSFSLRADWTQPNNMMSTSWKGPYYVPPGVVIELEPNDKDGFGNYCFRITRTDVLSGRSFGQNAVWYDSDGRPRPEWGATIRMPYPDPVRGRYISDGSGGRRWIPGNGVIFAEGNVRVRGMLPPGMKLTIVSNQNIYIEGNLLKYRPPQPLPRGDVSNYRAADPTCGLALLARQNVVVNTTQFMSPLSSIGPDDQGADSLLGGNSYHVVVRNGPDSRFRCRFDFGPYESETGNPPNRWFLFLRHSGEAGAAYINAWLNPTDTAANWRILNLNTGFSPNFPPHVFGVGDRTFASVPGPPGAGIGSSFLYNVFALDQVTQQPDDLFTWPGVPNILEIALDEATYARSNYWMGGCAVMPMDVRIEAIIYAQEGSFFVIPGYWINPDPSDTDPSNRPPEVDKRFPLYGQPMDIRIIIDGAVSENVPARIGDVEEWMAKWGRIPSEYGNSGIPTAHPGEGIAFLYDDHVGWPVDDSGTPIRIDAYGRTLPLCPKLPVSGSLVYFGDVM